MHKYKHFFSINKLSYETVLIWGSSIDTTAERELSIQKKVYETFDDSLEIEDSVDVIVNVFHKLIEESMREFQEFYTKILENSNSSEKEKQNAKYCLDNLSPQMIINKKGLNSFKSKIYNIFKNRSNADVIANKYLPTYKYPKGKTQEEQEKIIEAHKAQAEKHNKDKEERAEIISSAYEKIIQDEDVFSNLFENALSILSTDFELSFAVEKKLVSTKKVSDFYNTVDEQGTIDEDFTEEGREEGNTKENWQTKVRTRSMIEGLSGKLRRVLSQLSMYDINSEGKKKKQMTNLQTHRKQNPEYIYADLIRIFENITSSNEMIPALKALAEAKPWINDLILLIENDEKKNGLLKSQLYYALRNDRVQFRGSAIKKNGIEISSTFNETENITPYFEEWRKIVLSNANLISTKFYSQYTKYFEEDGLTIKKLYDTNGLIDDSQYKVLNQLRQLITSNFNAYEGLSVKDILDKPLMYPNYDSKEYETVTGESKDISELTVGNSLVQLFRAIGINEPKNIILSSLLSGTNKIITEDVINKNIKESNKKKSKEDVIKELTEKNIRINAIRLLSEIEHILNYKKGTQIKNDDLITRKKIYYKNIAKFFQKVQPRVLEDTALVRGIELRSNGVPAYASTLAKKLLNGDLESGNLFLEENYKKNPFFFKNGQWRNLWLRYLDANANIYGQKPYELLQFCQYIEQDKKEYKNWNYIDNFKMAFNQFNVGRENQSGEGNAFYRLPIPADADSAEFYGGPKFVNSNFKNEITNLLINVVLQELDRISWVTARSKNDSLDDFIPEYDIEKDENGNIINPGGSKFKFFPEFNNYTIQGELYKGEDFLTTLNNLKLESSRTELIKQELPLFMENKFKGFYNKLENEGLFELNEKFGVKKTFVNFTGEFKSEKQRNEFKQNQKDAIEKFFWNDYFAQSQIIQILTSDLAFYPNMETFFKRAKEFHSPAKKIDIYAKYNGKQVLINDPKTGKPRNRRNITLAENIDKSQTIEELEVAARQLKHLSKTEQNVIIEMYKNIAATDGQSLVTLKSYRDVQIMTGNWNKQKEIAYNNIQSGTNFNLNDITILLNTSKPYVYTQINKTITIPNENGENETIQIRVPLQYKNSEMIMPIQAIFGAIFKNSTLGQLSEFMDRNNIDVAHFESAVKVGKQKVIDLNNIINVKGKAIAYDHLKSLIGEAKDTNDLIESPYIDEFDYNDYGIQVATPNHSIDADILLGAQLKRITGADFIGGENGARFNVKIGNKTISMTLEQWRNHFESVQVASLTNNKDALLKRMSNSKGIADILKKEIMDNPRYSRDFQFTSMLDKNGNFIIPLNDETQRLRIEALLTGVINNSIVKQKTAGGSFIVTSDWVLPSNKKPKTIYKTNNNGKKAIDYMECYLPCPDSALADRLLQYNLDNGINSLYLDINAKDKDGKYIVPRGYLESVGYRIPTEAKYSMAPLKIKGFLSPQMGSIVILPSDVVTMSGSDFDIDKMFIMFKRLSMEIENGVSKFSLPEYNYKHTLNESKKDIANKMYKLSKEERDNILIDLIRSSLTSYDSIDKILPPGEFNEQKKISRIITILSNGEQKYSFKQLKEMSLMELSKLADEYKPILNPLDPNTRILFHLRNMVGTSLIGYVNNHNMNHLLCQLLGTELKKNFQFTINGITYTSLSDIQNQELQDPKNPKTGKYISYNIASFRFTANNNATDPIADEINLNINTVDYLMTLLRTGVPISTACLILCQPIIKDALKTKGDSKLPLSYFISKEVKLYVNHRLTTKVNQEYYSNIENSITDEMLAAQISNPANEEFDKNNATIGLFLSKIASISDDVKEFTNNTRMDSKSGLGGPYINDGISLIAKSSKMDNKVFSFKFTKVEKDKNVFEDTLEKDEIIKSPIPVLQAYYSYGLLLRRELFKNYFPQFSSDYNKMITAIESQLLNNKKLTAKNRELIQQHVIQFKMSKILTTSENTVTPSSDYFINQFPIDFMEYKKSLKNSIKFPFISMIKIKTERISEKRILYFDNIGKLPPRMIANYQREWNILFTNNENNTNIENDYAKNLFLYLTYRGFHFNPSTYSTLSTHYIKSQVKEYPQALKDCFTFNTEEIELFVDQFIRHNLQNSQLQFIHEVYINSDSAHYFSTAYKKNRIEIQTNNSVINSTKIKHFYNQFIKIKPVDNNTPIFYKYIKIQLKGVYHYLCLSEITENCTAIYKTITQLGVQHQLYEYNKS
ncbi:MAG: hypothetical protein R3Y59_07605 [bacterium]